MTTQGRRKILDALYASLMKSYAPSCWPHAHYAKTTRDIEYALVKLCWTANDSWANTHLAQFLIDDLENDPTLRVEILSGRTTAERLVEMADARHRPRPVYHGDYILGAGYTNEEGGGTSMDGHGNECRWKCCNK